MSVGLSAWLQKTLQFKATLLLSSFLGNNIKITTYFILFISGIRDAFTLEDLDIDLLIFTISCFYWLITFKYNNILHNYCLFYWIFSFKATLYQICFFVWRVAFRWKWNKHLMNAIRIALIVKVVMLKLFYRFQTLNFSSCKRLG